MTYSAKVQQALDLYRLEAGLREQSDTLDRMGDAMRKVRWSVWDCMNPSEWQAYKHAENIERGMEDEAIHAEDSDRAMVAEMVDNA